MSTVEKHLSRLAWSDVWAGFKQLLPISLFVVVFGVAFGLAAAQTGLGDAATLLMSALVFAGASQFAALELWGSQVPLFTLMVTVFAINARHLLMGVHKYTLRSRAACAVPDLAARRAPPPGALGRSARLRSPLLVGDRGEDALVAAGAAHRVVAAGSGVGSSPSGMGGLGRCCTFDRNRLAEDRRNHAETPRRSTPLKSSHVQSGPLCTWENFNGVERRGVSA